MKTTTIYRSTASRPCGSCSLARGQHTSDCADQVGLSFTGVMRAIEKGPEDISEARSPIPAWTLVAVMAGSVLMALGWMLNGPVSRMMYEAIQR